MSTTTLIIDGKEVEVPTYVVKMASDKISDLIKK